MHHYEIIAAKNNAIRRTNRRRFVAKMTGEKSSQKISILMLCYNNTDQFFAALDRLQQEELRSEFMITIVQNSDNESSLQDFENRISNYSDVTVLYPVANLGSAGGYALGQEYILSMGYSHLIMLEDDVELLQDQTVSDTIRNIQDNAVTFINPPINTDGEHSRYVQYACYPTALLQQSGIIDPRYYFRAEDLEWRKRLEHTIQTYGYHKVILDKDYYHPYLKSANNSGSRIYFSLRNQLWTCRKHRQGLMHLIVAVSQYSAFALLVLLRSGNILLLACIFYALRDGMRTYPSLEYHGFMIELLRRYQKFELKDIGFHTDELSFQQLKDKGVNIRHIIARTTIATADRHHLAQYPGKIVASGGFQPVWGTLAGCMKKLIVIEDLYREKHRLSGKIIWQPDLSRLVNILLFLPCVFVGSVASLVAGIRLLGVTSLRR